MNVPERSEFIFSLIMAVVYENFLGLFEAI